MKKEYWLWLAGIKKISNQKKQALLNDLKTPEAIFKADRKTLCQTKGIGDKNADAIIAEQSLDLAKRASDFIEKHGIAFVTQEDSAYPEKLKAIYNPPLAFFAKGNLSLLERDLTLGMVGSRKASPGGMSRAKQFAHVLGEAGFTIISGLASGIDKNSHEGALDTIGSTIAVMGTGINVCYPQENKSLYRNIAEKGLIITEFFMDEQPLAFHFPLRNRIISGLSEGVLVVEAGDKSGALITAGHALEQGKNVYAIPGDITRLQSAGVNRLLKEGAKLVTDPDDILEDFVYIKKEKNTGTKTYSEQHPMIGDDEQKLITLIAQGYNHIEELVQVSGYSVQQLNAKLSSMELDDLIQVEFGEIYLL